MNPRIAIRCSGGKDAYGGERDGAPPSRLDEHAMAENETKDCSFLDKR